MTIQQTLKYKSITVHEFDDPSNNGSTNNLSISDAKLIVIKAVGAGGSGGGAGDTDDVGCGGGGGQYAEIYLTTTHISSYTNLIISLGSGGASKTGQNNGDDGGDTVIYFDSSPDVEIVTCEGGQGGGHGNSFGKAGEGGSSGTISIGEGFLITGYSGKHGHNKGTLADNLSGGYGGDSQMGPGGLGAVHATASTVTDATDGIRGGGGGGGTNNGGADGASGAGGDGYVLITIFK